MINFGNYFFALFSLFLLSCNSPTSETEPISTPVEPANEAVYKPEEDVWTVERSYREHPYDFDTTLSNGYSLHFEYFDENGFVESRLILMKGRMPIDTLNTMGCCMPMKNLGYISADFSDCFAFGQTFGFGNGHEVQLLKKDDASVITKGYFVDMDEKNELLLYHNDNDSLMIYDVKRKKDNFLVDLNKCDYIDFMFSQLPQNVEIVKVTERYVELEIFRAKNKTIRKRYPR